MLSLLLLVSTIAYCANHDNFNPNTIQTEFNIIEQDTLSDEDSEHLTFKGVPITGTFDEFVNELRNKTDLKFIDSDSKNAKFKGNYWQYIDCDIRVSKDSVTGNVDFVCVKINRSYFIIEKLH